MYSIKKLRWVLNDLLFYIKSNKNIQWVFEIAVPKRRIICDKNKPMFCEVNRI